MKKSNLLAAVLAVLAAASAAKAEDIKVDFGGAVGGGAYDDLQLLYTSPSLVDHNSFLLDQFPMPTVESSCEGFEFAGEWYWPSGCPVPITAAQLPGLKDFAAARKAPGSRLSAGDIAAFFVSYADTHSDFAASVLPALASGETKFFLNQEGGAYAVNGKAVVRLDLAKLGKLAAAGEGQARTAPAQEIAARALQAGQAVYNAYQAWGEYHSPDLAR